MSHMDCASPDRANIFKLFKQKCQLYFSVQDAKKAKQVDHIMLLSGEEGLKYFNSLTLSDTEKNDSDHIWKRFEQQIEPKHNVRVARLYLQSYRQHECESVDDFMTRLKLYAQKCDRQKGTVQFIRGQSAECTDENFQHMSFAEIKISSVDTRDEMFATLNIKLESKP